MKTHTIYSAIANAMFNACVMASANSRPMVDKVLSSLDRKQGQIKRNDWNASLTLKTYKQLKQQGIMA